MKLIVAAGTDVGVTRRENEDQYAVMDCLYVVADGIGGRNGGGLASLLAVRALVDAFANNHDLELRRVDQRLTHAIEVANRAVYEAGVWDDERSGMGTTCVAIAFDGDSLAVAHVGDSRAYRLRDRGLVQLTRDHNLSEAYKAGLINDESRVARRGHALTRALGMRETVEVSIASHVVIEGDRYLLCSDGLTNLVGAVTIERILAGAPSVAAARTSLIEKAKRNGGTDNITVIVLSVE